MYMLSLNDGQLDFKTLEQKIYKVVCEVACTIMQDVLNELDDKLMAERDVDKYRNKGTKKTHIHTMMGVVEYSRRIYRNVNEDGKAQYVFLLDEYLNNETIGHVSTNLAEKIVERALEESYRKTAQAVNSTTNANLSHTTAWNVVQRIGTKLEMKERNLVNRYENGNLQGSREVDVLFQEADGVWLNMQGKDRPSRGRKREMKIAINYEGFKKRKGYKEGYETHHKSVCAGFHKSHDFKKLWEAHVCQQYNTDEIKLRIINGDGAPWIKPDTGYEDTHFQLDPFHISREVLRKVPEKKQAKKLNKLLKTSKIDKSFEYLTALLIEKNGDEDEFKKLGELYNYLAKNREGLTPYGLRGLKLPELPGELEYRGLGTMESSVCNIITLRMKNRKMSWSKKGANSLAKLLALRAGGRLYEVLDELFEDTVSEGALEEIVEFIELSAADVNKKPKNTGTYPIRSAPIPFEGQALTQGRKAIRDLVKNRAVGDLKF